MKEAITHLVLSHPHEVQVLAPADFVSEIEMLCEALCARYQK